MCQGWIWRDRFHCFLWTICIHVELLSCTQNMFVSVWWTSNAVVVIWTGMRENMRKSDQILTKFLNGRNFRLRWPIATFYAPNKMVKCLLSFISEAQNRIWSLSRAIRKESCVMTFGTPCMICFNHCMQKYITWSHSVSKSIVTIIGAAYKHTKHVAQ